MRFTNFILESKFNLASCGQAAELLVGKIKFRLLTTSKCGKFKNCLPNLSRKKMQIRHPSEWPCKKIANFFSKFEKAAFFMSSCDFPKSRLFGVLPSISTIFGVSILSFLSCFANSFNMISLNFAALRFKTWKFFPPNIGTSLGSGLLPRPRIC